MTAVAVDWKAAADKWRALARKWEARAKVNVAAAEELADLRARSAGAVEQAKATARALAFAEMAEPLAAGEIRAAAAGRLTETQTATLLDSLDLTFYIRDDGDVDTAKVRTLIDAIAPPTDPARRRSA